MSATLALAGCSNPIGDHSDTSSPPDPGYTMARKCPAAQVPEQGITVDLANFVLGVETDLRGWQAGDIGASAELSDGRIVWVFGDTVRAAGVEPRLVANSMLISAGACVSNVVTPEHGPVIDDVSDNVVRWPMSVVRLDPPEALASKYDDILVVLTGRIDRGDSGPFGFTFLGTDAVVFGVEKSGAPQPYDIIEVTPDHSGAHQVNWGAAAMLDGDWLYVYGTRRVKAEGIFGRELYVARVPAGRPRDRDQWQFFDGQDWRSGFGAARPILPARGGVSQTLSVDRTDDGRYLAVSKRDGDLGDFVYVWTADDPTGPWTPNYGVKAPAGFDTGKLKYAPLAHPEIPLANGKLLVSISRNTTDLEALLKRPKIGKPVFTEVEVPH